MTNSDLLTRYQGRLTELDTSLERARGQSLLAILLLVLSGAAFLLLGLSAIRKEISPAWPAVALACALVAGRQAQLRGSAEKRWTRLRRFYERAIERIQDRWSGVGSDGQEFIEPDHLYVRDLNIFGEGSLFQLLSTTRTAIGRRGLAEYLTKAPSLEEASARQQAVRELQDRTDLRDQIALLGDYDFIESTWQTFAEWLDQPVMVCSRWLRVAALVSPILVIVAVLCGLTSLIAWPDLPLFIGPLFAFQALVALTYRDRVMPMIVRLRTVALEIRVLREGLELIEAHKFQSPKLTQITGRVQHSSQAMRKLERLLNLLTERNKEWFYSLSILVMGGTQICMAVEAWRIQHGDALRGWLEVWAEFEALNALANYAYENPNNVYPEFIGTALFEGESFGHPLLPDETCIRNSVQLNAETRFCVISGSNMSGKSTLLRSIGLNVVLAQAGAPVRAHHLRLSRLAVCASLAVVDSLLSGKSKFMAEVDRLRLTIETAASGEAVLFLIDEIFSGTNSSDRRLAAEAVVRELLKRGAIGMLSTHDLSLTEIATPELCGRNVHTGSRDGTDPMDFDYRLKPGITNETNAVAIARMAGVPI